MNRLYTYYPEFDNDDCLIWHVYENATQQVIESFLFEDDAINYMTELEKGKAFNGFTPAFMLMKVTNIDINAAFSAEFS